MLDILQFTKWIKKELNMTCYPLMFPATAPKECSVVTLTDIMGSKGDVKNFECAPARRASGLQCNSDNGPSGASLLRKLRLSGIQFLCGLLFGY